MSGTALTLYEVEDDLAVLLEMEEDVTPEMEEEYRLAVNRALESTQAKREACAQFILSCESAADFCKQEEARIRRRRQVLQNAADRVREYVLGFIMRQGIDPKGKFQKLVGKTTTMSTRACPAAVEVMNEEAVPARYKTVVCEMPLEVWHVLVDRFPSETAGALKSVAINKRAIKEAIDSGENVEGTDLNLGAYTLVVR